MPWNHYIVQLSLKLLCNVTQKFYIYFLTYPVPGSACLQFHKSPHLPSFWVEILLVDYLVKSISRHYLFLYANIRVHEEGKPEVSLSSCILLAGSPILWEEGLLLLFLKCLVSNFPAFCLWVKSKGNKLQSPRNFKINSYIFLILKPQNKSGYNYENNFQYGGKMSPLLVLVCSHTAWQGTVT